MARELITWTVIQTALDEIGDARRLIGLGPMIMTSTQALPCLPSPLPSQARSLVLLELRSFCILGREFR